jgi:uncharacterized RDD family membrane protein YckC
MNPRTWWYADGNAKAGPVPEEELRTLIQSRAISRDALVWSEGMAEWKRARDVRELIEPSLGSTTPPPLPGLQGIETTASDPYTPPRTNAAVRGTEPPVDLAFLNEPLAGPWRRFFARQLDVVIIGLPVAFVVSAAIAMYSLAFALWVQKPGSDWIFAIGVVPVMLCAETIVFGVLGTTPGKALLGVKVRTLRGETPGIAAYFARQIGVYFQGLGMGIPLVTLFTMGSQYGRVSRGESAGYDQGVFRVTASPLGFFRITGAVLAIIGAIFLQGALTHIDNEARRAQSTSITWTNPETLRQATLPAGWSAREATNPEGFTVYMFSNTLLGAEAVFASEAFDRNATVEQYAEVWRPAVAADMTLERDANVEQLDLFETAGAHGHLVSDPSVPVSAVLVRHDDKIWRIVTLGVSEDAAAATQLRALRDALLYTLPDTEAAVAGQ